MKTLKLILYFVLTTILTTMLPFSGILMPLVFIFSGALFVAMSVKWNVLYAVFSTVFSGLLIYFISDFSSGTVAGLVWTIALPFVVFLSALGIYIALKRKASVKVVVLAGTTGYFALIIAAYLLYGGNFIADMLNVAKSFVIDSLDSIKASVPAGSDMPSFDEIKSMYEQYFENLKILAPSIILSLFFLLSYFTLKVSSHFAKKNDVFDTVPAFSEIHAPFFLAVAGVISYIGQLASNTFISGLSANVFMALSVYYTLCGYSLIDFFVKLRIKSLAARLAIYLGFTLILAFVSVILYFANPILIAMLLGLLDSIFNYRVKIRIMREK